LQNPELSNRVDELVELFLPELTTWLLRVWSNGTNLDVREACPGNSKQSVGWVGTGEEDVNRAITLCWRRGDESPDPSAEACSFLSH
jgi:hypothetical protein